MIDFGIVKPGSTLYIPFTTYAGSTGASVTLTGLTTGDIKVYKNGNTAERATDGYLLLDTDGIDFDALTGIHGFSINLADNTEAGFFAAGARYWVVIADVTVDSQTVRFVAATFTIGLPGAVLNTTVATLASQTSFTLTAGPAQDDALNGCILYLHGVGSAVTGGFAVVADYTGSTLTVTLPAGTTFTLVAGDNVMVMPPALVPTVLGRTLDVSATGEAGVDWANVGSPTTTLNLSATTIKTATDVETDTADIQTRLPAALVSGRMDSSTGAMAAGVLTATAIAADAIGASELAADAVAEIADAVWDELIAGHVIGGSTGEALAAAGGAGDPWITPLPGAYGAGTAGKIVGDNINATISSRATQTSVDAVDDFIDTEVAAINVRGERTVVRATATTGASTTSIPTSAFSPAGAAADQFKGRIVVFDNDTATAALRGQATDITASSNNATPTLTVTALTTAPASGDTFSVL